MNSYFLPSNASYGFFFVSLSWVRNNGYLVSLWWCPYSLTTVSYKVHIVHNIFSSIVGACSDFICFTNGTMLNALVKVCISMILYSFHAWTSIIVVIGVKTLYLWWCYHLESMLYWGSYFVVPYVFTEVCTLSLSHTHSSHPRIEAIYCLHMVSGCEGWESNIEMSTLYFE